MQAVCKGGAGIATLLVFGDTQQANVQSMDLHICLAHRFRSCMLSVGSVQGMVGPMAALRAGRRPTCPPSSWRRCPTMTVPPLPSVLLSLARPQLPLPRLWMASLACSARLRPGLSTRRPTAHARAPLSSQHPCSRKIVRAQAGAAAAGAEEDHSHAEQEAQSQGIPQTLAALDLLLGLEATEPDEATTSPAAASAAAAATAAATEPEVPPQVRLWLQAAHPQMAAGLLRA